MRYYLKMPTGRHVRFRIVCREETDTQLQHSTLDAVNQSYLDKKLSRNEAEKSLRELVRQLNKEDRVIFNSENEGILEKYWAKVYGRRLLVDKQAAWWPLLRAIKVIGPLSLVTASFEELQDAVNTAVQGNKQRRVVQSLNQLLIFLHRDFKLNKMKPVKERVKYLTETELNLMLPHLPSDPIRLLHQVCFYTGARIGEALAFDGHSLSPNGATVRIEQQLDKKGVLRETKTRISRKAFIPANGILAFKKWLLCKGAIDQKTRTRMAKITKSACARAFPTDKSKHCKFHDMRHSYAIALVSQGVGLTPISKCLGNSLVVCERYYSGFELTDETVLMIQKILGG